MIDRRRPLVVLAWAEIEAAKTPLFSRKDRNGQVVEGADLFGPT